MMRLKDKVAIVTGGGSGIGAAICNCFAQQGASVVVTDINLAGAQNVVDQIIKSGGNAMAVEQDVVDEQRWSEVIAITLSEFGGLDVLVNNAGIGMRGSVESTTLAEWQRTQSINLDSVFLGTQQAVRAMKQNGGSIINISSIEGIVGEATCAAYNASKGGVRIFTKSAALHCANEGYRIRVNSIHPGFIATPLVIAAIESLPASEAEQLSAQLLAKIPFGELGNPEDIANGALFLASDESRYMTGSELVIDGGYTAQ
ncbi:glucose 1-dehydrogenase [Zhongshania aliphaticivorans]|nr:glucose 1-dehydrogenase [Zhongshania aliphaticivorans]